MKDIWNRDPAAWREMPFVEQLEMMRKWHCTGPCGQSSTTMGTRSALGKVLKDAQSQAAEIQRLKTHLSDMTEAIKNAFPN